MGVREKVKCFKVTKTETVRLLPIIAIHTSATCLGRFLTRVCNSNTPETRDTSITENTKDITLLFNPLV